MITALFVVQSMGVLNAWLVSDRNSIVPFTIVIVLPFVFAGSVKRKLPDPDMRMPPVNVFWPVNCHEPEVVTLTVVLAPAGSAMTPPNVFTHGVCTMPELP